ncbi:Vacuolar import and degradation protein 27 [Sorochytrium milnesiophthora]
MNFLKSLLFSGGAQDGHPIPQPIDRGQLYLVRPSGVKGLRECLFQDARASIRSTARQFLYELVITRMFDEDDEPAGASSGDRAGADDDELYEEQTFLIDPALQIYFGQHEGCKSIVWRDMDGEAGDVFEFVCDDSIGSATVEKFQRSLLQCLYQRQYERTHENATAEELDALIYVKRGSVSAAAAPATPPKATEAATPSSSSRKKFSAYDEFDTETPRPPKQHHADKTPTKPAKLPTPQKKGSTGIGALPPVRVIPSGQSLLTISGPLFLYDTTTQSFVPCLTDVGAEILKASDCEYWIGLWHDDQPILGQSIDDNMNMFFAEEKRVAIWNYFNDEQKPISVALMLADAGHWQDLKRLYSECVVEVSIGEALSKLKLRSGDKEYLSHCAYTEDTDMRDAEPLSGDEHEDDDRLDAADDDREAAIIEQAEAEKKEEEQQDETDDEENAGEEGYAYKAPKHVEEKNSHLAVSYRNDRSFVVRGDKIGVFAHTNDDNIRFDTTISNICDSSGRNFTPTKTMLHDDETKMVLMHPSRPHDLMEMDLATGKIVNEWNVHDIVPVNNIVNNAKYAQMEHDKTFIGMSHNAIFRIDPRQKDNKIRENEWQQMMGKVGFTAAATGGNEELVVGNQKGELSLYNKVGIRAKTQLPDAIAGLDVTADGKWVVATCKTYLLLVDTTLPDTDATGFVKRMGEHKPAPIRLSLKPETVAAMGAPLHFTTAHFNTGEEGEQTIVSSSGPYVVTWNFKKILQQRERERRRAASSSSSSRPSAALSSVIHEYHIKRYPDHVVADQFKYGTPKAIVVALPHDVTMVKTRSLQAPGKATASIGNDSELSTPTRNLRSRSSVVNAPY